jgi:hypothetical protein
MRSSRDVRGGEKTIAATLSEDFRNSHRFSKDSLPWSSVLSVAMTRSSSFLLILLIGAAFGTFPQTGLAQSKKTRTSKSAAVKPVSFPKIRAAIASLEAARAELAKTDKDMGGHKKDALEALDNALKKLRLALQFEKY